MEWLAPMVLDLLASVKAGLMTIVFAGGELAEGLAIYFMLSAMRLFALLEGTSLDYIYQDFLHWYDLVTADYFQDIK